MKLITSAALAALSLGAFAQTSNYAPGNTPSLDLPKLSISNPAKAFGQPITLTVPVSDTAFGLQTGPTFSSWSGSVYFNLRDKTFSAVVMNEIGSLTVHGKPVGVDLEGFAGAVNKVGAPSVLGVAVIWKHQILDQVGVMAGVAGSLTGGSNWGGGFIIGATVSFK